MKTRATQILGIEHPVVQGGMQWVATTELAAAVSNAGALGIIGPLTTGSPESLVRKIRRCRELTDRPFGVNLTIVPSISPAPYDEYRDVIVNEEVSVVETAGNNPGPFVDVFKAQGITTRH
jgi:NAD(P)H-dependent flavin oxidoreductase YrpB (nitropropane dioxygenase family)